MPSRRFSGQGSVVRRLSASSGQPSRSRSSPAGFGDAIQCHPRTAHLGHHSAPFPYSCDPAGARYAAHGTTFFARRVERRPSVLTTLGCTPRPSCGVWPAAHFSRSGCVDRPDTHAGICGSLWLTVPTGDAEPAALARLHRHHRRPHMPDGSGRLRSWDTQPRRSRRRGNRRSHVGRLHVAVSP